MNDKNIQWPRAKYWTRPWNPMVGCIPISPACENCYAKASTDRFKCSFDPHEATRKDPPKRGVVFCGNMTDLFGSWVETEKSIGFIEKTIGNPSAEYIWLTKRPTLMCLALERGRFWSGLLENQYFGFTAENQKCYDERLNAWRSMFPFGLNGWLSVEPLLEPIDLHLGYIAPEDLPFKWVVVGCESGSGRRPCSAHAIRSIVHQCVARDIPVFVKQMDINGRCERDIAKFPDDLQIRQVPWEAKYG